jgi:hypothetical protein
VRNYYRPTGLPFNLIPLLGSDCVTWKCKVNNVYNCTVYNNQTLDLTQYPPRVKWENTNSAIIWWKNAPQWKEYMTQAQSH